MIIATACPLDQVESLRNTQGADDQIRKSPARAVCRRRAILAGALAIAAAAYCPAAKGAGPALTGEQRGSIRPDVVLTLAQGGTTTLDSLRQGRAAVLVFWTTWCKSCKKQWPYLKRIARQLETAADAPIWASVAVDEPAERVDRAARERGLPGVALVDPGERISKAWGVKYVPTVCVFGRDGKLIYKKGAEPKELAGLLEGLISEPQPAENAP